MYMLMHMPVCLKKLVVYRLVQAAVYVHMQAWQSCVACLGFLAAAQSTWMSALD